MSAPTLDTADGPYLGKRFKVEITRTADGVKRIYDHGHPYNIWDDGTDYMWTDGNYGCDCNRHLFFCRAVGEDEYDQDRPCGETRYRATAILEDGTRVEFQS